jgi:hypothetical protein
MAKLQILAGSTSQTVNIFIQDTTKTNGGGLTGLAFNTSGLTAYYALPSAASVAITLATLAAVTSAYSSGGFKEIDATNMPGWYRFDIPNAAIASGRFVALHFRGATNMAETPIEIELTATNNQSATAFITGVNSVTITGDAYARLGAPAGASVSADIAAIKSDTGTILTDVNTGAGAIYTRLGAPAGASIAADIAAVKTDTGTSGSIYTRIGAPVGASISADIANVKPSIMTTAMTESYAAVGVAPTLVQGIFMLLSGQQDSVSGTTLTNYKIDGVTAAQTFTLNSATTPTSVVRAT